MTWLNARPVLERIAGHFGCEVGEIENWIERNLGKQVHKAQSSEQRLNNIRVALGTPEAASIIDCAGKWARRVKRKNALQRVG